MAAGDKVVLYTDGIPEAMNAQGEMFGFDRLLETVKAGSGLDARALLEHVQEEVKRFCGLAPQHDDLTAIVLHVVRGSASGVWNPPGEDGV
jgi:sigma-B regulation protein RsbU (phosphoserine phosphatase)